MTTPRRGKHSRPTPRRRSPWAPAAGVAAVVLGATAVIYVVSTQQSAPEPPLAATSVAVTSSPADTAADASTGSPVVPGPTPVTPTASALLPSATTGAVTIAPATPAPDAPRAASDPTRVRLPTITVDAPTIPLGLQDDGTVQVPPPGDTYDDIGWFTGAATPGEAGAAVLLGHLDSAKNGPSVFYQLGALAPGDPVEIDRADNSTALFTVDEVTRFPKDAFPTDRVYSTSTDAQLRLITCGGPLEGGHYTDNTVVFAHLTGFR